MTSVSPPSINDFKEECEAIEELVMCGENHIAILPLYQSLYKRMRASDHAGDPKLKSLYTFALSRIYQLNIALEPKLVINIQGFLEGVQKDINTLATHVKNDMIRVYKESYVGKYEAKINEAVFYIEKLNKDIRSLGGEIKAHIQNLLGQVTSQQAQLNGEVLTLDEQRQKLKELLSKKFLFDFLKIFTSTVGSFFPPAGPIVGEVLNIGLTIVEDPSKAPSQIGALVDQGEKLHALLKDPKKSDKFNSTIVNVKDFVDKIKPAFEAGVRLHNSVKSIEDKIKEAEEAIEATIAEMNQLSDYKVKVSTQFHGILELFAEEASQLQSDIKDDSRVALLFDKVETARSFEKIRTLIQNFTKGFAAGDGFVSIMDQMERSIEISMNIYDLVQQYQDHMALAVYMADLAAVGAAVDPLTEKYKLKAQRNIVLEQYCRAVSAVRQWSFPFGSFFVDEFADLTPFEKTTDHQSFITLVNLKMGLLQAKVRNYKTTIQTYIDSALHPSAVFSINHGLHSRPFYIWSGEEYKSELAQLFSGENIHLFADIQKAPVEKKSAVKFSKLDVKIRHDDPAVENDLTAALNHCKVRLVHSGFSEFKYGNVIYGIQNDGDFDLEFSFDRKSNNEPSDMNGVAQKLWKSDDLMLSPYTHWSMQLIFPNSVVREQLFAALDKDKNFSKLKIYLEGEGSYVDETRIFPHHRLKLDPSYTATTTGCSTLPAVASIPRIDIPGSNINADAFVNKGDDRYWYTARDISTIRHSPTLTDELQNIDFIEPVSITEMESTLSEILSLSWDKPFLCVYNVGFHWVTFCLINNGHGVTALYKDSLGGRGKELQTVLDKKFPGIEFKFHPNNEQSGDGSICGVLAIENMRIMAKAIRKDQDQFIRDFERLTFCSLAKGQTLRSTFGTFYEEGIDAEKQMEKVRAASFRQIRIANHQKAIDITAELNNKSLQYGMTATAVDPDQTAILRSDVIAVSIGVNPEDNSHHYRIESKRSVDDLKIILGESSYRWEEGRDYSVVDGVIKVHTKI